MTNIINILKGLSSMIKNALKDRYRGFEINRMRFGYLTYIPSENDENNIMNDISTMITPGRFH